MRRLLEERLHARIRVDAHHAEGSRLISGTSMQPTVRSRDARRDRRASCRSPSCRRGPRQHEHILRRIAAQDVEVLEHRVGGAEIPRRVDALLGGQQLDELAHAPVHARPAALHVADEALRLVLRRDADARMPS